MTRRDYARAAREFAEAGPRCVLCHGEMRPRDTLDAICGDCIRWLWGPGGPRKGDRNSQRIAATEC